MRINTAKTIVFLHRDREQSHLIGRILQILLADRGYSAVCAPICPNDLTPLGEGISIQFGTNVTPATYTVDKADFILSTDFTAAIPWIPWLKSGGRLISCYPQQEADPSVSSPDPYIAEGYNIDIFDTSSLDPSEFSSAVVHMALLGRLAWYFDISDPEFYAALCKLLPQADVQTHYRAYILGKKTYGKILYPRN